jgi:hypothetical protein
LSGQVIIELSTVALKLRIISAIGPYIVDIPHLADPGIAVTAGKFVPLVPAAMVDGPTRASSLNYGAPIWVEDAIAQVTNIVTSCAAVQQAYILVM